MSLNLLSSVHIERDTLGIKLVESTFSEIAFQGALCDGTNLLAGETDLTYCSVGDVRIEAEAAKDLILGRWDWDIPGLDPVVNVCGTDYFRERTVNRDMIVGVVVMFL